ncbi:Multidrug resistance protein MdtF [Hyalomma marginatum]|uniref:Multidrug resistance protein MdtF n=1 Tax=Hyalomma marginatum TaxID=34627 RepID=A0A8S4C170_9ACAR|nr:Multidrug resistance protein MdtF [Hyalomma marginatum]CAG7597286.1 Multidrug resistance protein MdtF [Hyalomma marginatum]
MEILQNSEKTFKDAQTIARVNGKSAVILEISKRSGANIINTVAAVKEMIKENSKFLPAFVEIMYSQDQSDQINEMIADLENSIILAGILVIMVIVLSVGVRSALLIALSLLLHS